MREECSPGKGGFFAHKTCTLLNENLKKEALLVADAFSLIWRQFVQ